MVRFVPDQNWQLWSGFLMTKFANFGKFSHDQIRQLWSGLAMTKFVMTEVGQTCICMAKSDHDLLGRGIKALLFNQ